MTRDSVVLYSQLIILLIRDSWNGALDQHTYALPNQGPLIADPSVFPERERAGVDRLSGVNGA